MAVNFRLPSSRHLAKDLAIARNSVVTAYEMLVAEGYASANQGSGTFVLSARRVASERGRESLGAQNDAPTPARIRCDFSAGTPDISLFPLSVWHRLHNRATRSMSSNFATFGDPAGIAELRHAISGYISFTRAVASTANEIIVTSGAQQAFYVIAQSLVKPGKTIVAIEDPCYPPVRAAFAACGAKIVGVPVDRDGICVEKIPRAAEIICVTPSHQFPLGIVMSPERRQALLVFARRHGAYVIEDDYDCEFRYESRPLDALQTLAQDIVFYVGTFSKTLFPALRLGFTVVPQHLLQKLIEAKRLVDGFGPPVSQKTLADFILEGHLRRHIWRMQRVYSARRQTLLNGLEEHFGKRVDILTSSAGLHLAVRLHTKRRWKQVLSEALDIGIMLEHAAEYRFQCEAQDVYILAFGGMTEQKIKSGLAGFASIILDR